MEVYLEEKFAQQVIAISKSFGVDAKVVGWVEAADTKKVTLKTALGTFVY
jgi:phosphoribosylformylglycinamidine cyclo-ligase